MLTRSDFKKYEQLVTDWISRYYDQIEDFPVRSQVKPREIYSQIPPTLPLKGVPFETIIKDLDEIILPGITHWQHPNFHAYFAANTSIESLFGEMLTSAISAQCMMWATSPAAAELEERMMEWMGIAMGIPSGWEGVIQDTASSASLVAIITAREVKTGFRSNFEGVPANLRVYCSTETHSSVEKAMAISGLGRDNLVKIEVDSQQQMLVPELEQAIKSDLEDGKVPCAIVAAVGTTGTLAVDPLSRISTLARKYDVWLHIDAAYAGTALFLPEYRWMIEGIELADSFVFNPHKWLFTNFDCSAYFVKDAHLLIRTFEILPEYLNTPTRGKVNDYKDWGIALGRRFRALKLWFVLRSYGQAGVQLTLRNHIEWTLHLAETMKENSSFEIVRKPFLNFFCFRLVMEGKTEDELNELNERYLRRINDSGEAYLSHTRIRNKYVIRVVIGQTYVKKHHVNSLLSILLKFSANL